MQENIYKLPKKLKLSMQSCRWHPRVVQPASWLVREMSSP